jgi:hypothetical protein
MSNRREVEGIDWPADRYLPAFQAPQQLTVYDLRGASQDILLSATTMAGLINRPQPKVYLISSDEEVFWVKQSLGQVAQQAAQATGDAVLAALLISFRDAIKGMIIYDPGLIDSINVATTMAGQRGGIVVSPAQAQGLQQAHQLPILDDLRAYNWKSRLQAYDWARQNLLPNCSSRVVAGLDPKVAPGVRSFLVAANAFVYFLDSRNILPDFINGLQSERGLMQVIFKEYPPGAVHLGWFIDEASGVSLTSEAAIAVLASDFFYNLEVWTSVQPATTPQVRATPLAEVIPTLGAGQVAISFTISDGDNLQYIQHRMLRLWQNADRGSFPLGWTISPSLLHAAPSMVEYYYQTASTNDEFIAGPSGAGYMFPSRWPEQEYPAFLQHTGQLMNSMDLTELEILDTNFFLSTGILPITFLGRAGMNLRDTALQARIVQGLLPFGLRGLLNGNGNTTPETLMIQSVPVLQNLGLADSVDKTVRLVRNATASPQNRQQFLNIYVMAWTMTPSDIKEVIQQLGSQYVVVTPRTLMEMIVQAG